MRAVRTGGDGVAAATLALLARALPAIAIPAIAIPALLLAALPARAGAQVMDQAIYTYVALDELEYAHGVAERPVTLDGELWTGGDFNRLWLKVGGERSTVEDVGELEAQVLYGRFVAPFWDAQVGLRLDAQRGATDTDVRAHLALGLQGLAPYWFELDPTLFVSQDGDVSARLEASYELLFTQRLILEPELEVNVAVQEVPDWGVGSGVNDVELAARLRYEIVRELAPYVGFSWHRRVGETADLARARGEDAGEGSVVVGVRAWW